jgi:hypothetical protein
MSVTPVRDSKGKTLPFAQQPREFQIDDMASAVAGFVMVDRSGLSVKARIDWYMDHTSVAEKDEATRAEVRALVAERVAAEA